MESRLEQLSLKTGPGGTHMTPQSKKKGKAPVADSWEDESLSDEEAGDSDLSKSTSMPNAPPPTPISPNFSGASEWDIKSSQPYGAQYGSERDDDASPRRRPEKSTAAAGRMIAGALGVRAPKKTEEQRAYDRATKENEIKRRTREREEAAKRNEETEKARAAAWDR